MRWNINYLEIKRWSKWRKRLQENTIKQWSGLSKMRPSRGDRTVLIFRSISWCNLLSFSFNKITIKRMYRFSICIHLSTTKNTCIVLESVTIGFVRKNYPKMMYHSLYLAFSENPHFATWFGCIKWWWGGTKTWSDRPQIFLGSFYDPYPDYGTPN